MKKLIVFFALLVTLGCNPDKEVVSVIKGETGAAGANGADGSSCSVSDYTLEGEEESQVLGAVISCTDGSSAIILNGQDGLDGLDGLNGEDGIDGVDGKDGKSCTVKRKKRSNYAVVKCGKKSVHIYDGQDGRDGQDGEDGEDGQDGEQGPQGEQGIAGTDGDDGAGSILTSITLVQGSDAFCKKNIYPYNIKSPNNNGTCDSGYTLIPATNCTVIDGNNSAKQNGSSSEVKLYSTTNCSGSSTSLHDGEVAVTDNGNLLFNVAGSDNLQLLTFTQEQ